MIPCANNTVLRHPSLNFSAQPDFDEAQNWHGAGQETTNQEAAAEVEETKGKEHWGLAEETKAPEKGSQYFCALKNGEGDNYSSTKLNVPRVLLS